MEGNGEAVCLVADALADHAQPGDGPVGPRRGAALDLVAVLGREAVLDLFERGGEVLGVDPRP